MTKVLDLDLDYFVWPIINNRTEEEGRPTNEEFEYIASKERLQEFLEDKCGLSTNTRLPGAEFVEHVDAFWTWDRWIREQKITAQFDVVHVDAHADLGIGFGETSWEHLLIDLLAQPPEKRNHPKTGLDGLHSGSYLAFALANRWIASAKYVYPVAPSWLVPVDDPNDFTNGLSVQKLQTLLAELEDEREANNCPKDIVPMYFRDETPSTGLIELPHFTWEQRSLIFCLKGLVPAHREPPVSFECISGDDYKDSGFTHLVVAQSPTYLPESADELMAVVREYFNPV